MKMLISITGTVLIGVIGYILILQINNEPNNSENTSTQTPVNSEQKLASKPEADVLPDNATSINMTGQFGSGNFKPTTSESNDKCMEQATELTQANLDRLINETTEEQRLNLFLLTGWDPLISKQSQNLSFEQRSAQLNSTKKRQVKLLEERARELDNSLYIQLYLEACSTNDISDFCHPDDLEQLVATYRDNLIGWLTLINYYNNRGNTEKITELVDMAADAGFLDNLQNTYYREIFTEVNGLVNSPTYAANIMLDYGNKRFLGLGSLTRHCNNNQSLSCYRIGETLANYSNLTLARITGLQLQLDYLTNTGDSSNISLLTQEINEIKSDYANVIDRMEIPKDDQMASYLVSSLDIVDEIEYFKAIQKEALRIREENSDLCLY